MKRLVVCVLFLAVMLVSGGPAAEGAVIRHRMFILGKIANIIDLDSNFTISLGFSNDPLIERRTKEIWKNCQHAKEHSRSSPLKVTILVDFEQSRWRINNHFCIIK